MLPGLKSGPCTSGYILHCCRTASSGTAHLPVAVRCVLPEPAGAIASWSVRGGCGRQWCHTTMLAAPARHPARPAFPVPAHLLRCPACPASQRCAGGGPAGAPRQWGSVWPYQRPLPAGPLLQRCPDGRACCQGTPDRPVASLGLAVDHPPLRGHLCGSQTYSVRRETH